MIGTFIHGTVAVMHVVADRPALVLGLFLGLAVVLVGAVVVFFVRRMQK